MVHGSARCAAAWCATSATRECASGSGEVALVTQAAGVVLVQGIVCRAGWPRLPTATLQDGCKMNGLQRSARANHSVAHRVSCLHVGQMLPSAGSR